MSNPPFGSPLFGEEEDFSFLINEALDGPINNGPNPFPIEETSPNSLPRTPVPMSNYQDLSMFLNHEEEFPLIGQFPTTSQEILDDWVREIELGAYDFDDLVQQGSPDDDGHGIQQKRLIEQGDHDHDHQTADGGVGQGSSIINKLDHRARERVRRMKLSASYLALRSLLPDSKRAYYKRWTAPYILDRTLDYIPRLQAEIRRLTLEKNKFLSLIGKQQQQQQQQQQRALASDRDKRVVNKLKQTLNVSINEVKRGELIVQICQQKGKLDHIFSALIKKLEGEDIQIIGASSICISEDTSCFHLHVQVCQNPLEVDYVADLQKKLIYWLS
ncbi:hypothetical protein Cgig2_020538 [Carnegiea gigantea]|uniref:BHLH domain-containing protein n=1 Tax=Carnegiea gigantea TaxID=171969 RepID=A0A9Q1JRC8_9CARY|nr:hypothetical protein Cgig2_020538 [Carnegiea gigantea]